MNKKFWILLVFILSGIVIGGLLGQLLGATMPFLSYGKEFGISTPFVLDLEVLQLTFGVLFNLNIASIIGLVVAILLYKLVMR